MRMGSQMARVASVAACLLAARAPLPAETGAKDLRALTGARARLVWLRDTGDGSDTMAVGSQLQLMSFDTDGGHGVRPILPAPGSLSKPLLTPAGERVVFTDRAAGRVCVVGFNGQGLRPVVAGHAVEVWAEPGSGREWVYVKVPDAGAGNPIRRYLLDGPQLPDPASGELVWDRSPSDGHNFQLSADGTRASALLPWPDAHVAELPNRGSQRFARGCWTSLAPDNSYLAWVFDGAHRGVELHGPGFSRKVDVHGAPGMDGWEVYHPRWSNHVRFLCLTGPYRQGGRGRNNIRQGGPGVEIYVGRWAPDFDSVEAWARVTYDRHADFMPDLWITGGERATVADTLRTGERPDLATVQTPADLGKEWPGSHAQLLFLWDGMNRPNRIRDAAAGVDRSCRTTLRGRAVPATGGSVDLAGGSLVAEALDGELLAACRASHQLAIEAVFTPANTTQRGPARIVTFSRSANARNFTLGQEQDRLVLRLRTPQTGDNGVNPQTVLATLPAGQRCHVIVSYLPGRLQAFVNGSNVLESSAVQGDFANWSEQSLRCGDEADGGRDWAGTLDAVAIYSRFVGPDEAVAKHRQWVSREAARRAPPVVTLEARLATVLPVPTAEMLDTYRRALVLCEYDVVGVVTGVCAAPRIAVAHWAVLDREPVAVYQARQVGQTCRLELTAWNDRPELEGERRFEELSDPLLPVFYCAER